MKKGLAKTTVFLMVVLFSNSVLSQQGEYIIGRLLDAKTQEPIAFASIRIKDRALGIISNIDGSFKIPSKYKEYGDIIEISSMGYQTKEILIHDFSIYELNIIRLQPSILKLDEAFVKGKKPRKLSAAQIVKKAIRAIPSNYPKRAYASIGYYRDYQLKKEKYVNLNEAILEVIDSGFDQHDFKTTKVRLYDYQSNEDFKKDFEGRFKYDYKGYKKFIDKAYLSDYGGNEFTILRIHDAIRNFEYNSFDFVNVMKRDFIENHFFKKNAEIRLDEDVVYEIEFSRILPRYRMFGKIYISKRDFAIYKMEYTLYDKTKTVEGRKMDKNGFNNIVLFKIITEYARSYGKMYPNYISFFNTFLVSKPPEFIVEEVFLDGPRRCLVVKFNDFVDEKTGAKKGNYDIRFDGRKFDFDKIKVFDVEVELYPNLSNEIFNNMVREMDAAQRKKIDLMALMSAEVTDVSNRTGTAIVNEMKYEAYKQFREYFVQEIKPNGSVLKDTLFMKKDIPIFKDQRTIKPDNFDDYWMNTPLQNVENQKNRL